jgi:hypothetical protein
MFGFEMGSLEVLVNGTASVWSRSGQQQNSGTTPWGIAEIDLSAYAGQTISVTFKATRGTEFRSDIALDNIEFDLLSCLRPSALTATNLTGTSADLSWTENDIATSWDIELVDLTSGGSPSGTPTSTGVTNPFTVTGLTEGSEYEYYVRSNCQVNGLSGWAGPLFRFITPCTSSLTAPYTQDFSTFTTNTYFDGFNFTAENCWTATASNTNNSYYWKSVPGSDNGFTPSGPDPSITTGNYFIVYNNGASSGDVTELVSPLVDLGALSSPVFTFNYHMFGADMGSLEVLVNGTASVWSRAGEQQVSGTTPWGIAEIDLSAYAGQTISVTFKATSAGNFYGDIALDNIEFIGCEVPTALTVTNLTDVTADLSWTENGSASSWDIEIVNFTAGDAATGTPTVTGITNPYTVTGLIPNNIYFLYVRASCSPSINSAWSAPSVAQTKQIVDLSLNINTLLQGPLLSPIDAGLMNDDLRSANIIPSLSPYDWGDIIPDTNVFNAGGITGTGLIQDNIVDWVWVEIRSASDNTLIVDGTSALVQRDGDIVALDGVSNVILRGFISEYYVVVKHRNHLGVMTLNKVALSTNPTNIDFTNSGTATFGANARVQLSNGAMALWSGDANGDGKIAYSGSSSDVTSIRSQVFNDSNNSIFGGPPVPNYGSLSYSNNDINMNGKTYYTGSFSDSTFIRSSIFNNPSNSIFGGPPVANYIFTQQLPEGGN